MLSAFNTDWGCESVGISNRTKHTPMRRGRRRPNIKLECDRLKDQAQIGPRASFRPAVRGGSGHPMLRWNYKHASFRFLLWPEVWHYGARSRVLSVGSAGRRG